MVALEVIKDTVVMVGEVLELNVAVTVEVRVARSATVGVVVVV